MLPGVSYHLMSARVVWIAQDLLSRRSHFMARLSIVSRHPSLTLKQCSDRLLFCNVGFSDAQPKTCRMGKSHPVLIKALSHIQLKSLTKGTSMKGYVSPHRVTSYL